MIDVRHTGGVDAERLITDMLNDAALKLEGARVRIHVYGDGSIDGELAYPARRGESLEESMGKIEDAIRGPDDKHRSLPTDIWISVGARFALKADEEASGSRRFRGMDDIGVHYQNAKQANIAEVFAIFDRFSAPGLRKKYRRKAELTFLRLHWNPHRKQPQY